MLSILKYSKKKKHLNFFGTILCFMSLVFFSPIQTQAQEDARENVQNVQGEGTEVSIPNDPQAIAHGRDLFRQHCSACHMIEKQLIGPALASVHGTRPTDWLLRFIKNSQKVISDPEEEYAQQLFSQYNEQIMPAFEFLSDDDIMSILAYIKEESVSETAATGVGASGSAETDESMSTETDVLPDDATDEAYTQDGDGVVSHNIFTGSSITVLIIFAVSLVALVIAVIYLNKGRRSKGKHKTNA